MEELNKKIIGNAVSAYFMVGVCIFFLFNKSPYMNHPFVKSHVKVAFSLHMFLFFMLFIMSYPFLDSSVFLGYSINTIITAGLSLFLFGTMLYGMFQAHRGHTLTVGEAFHKTGASKNVIRHNSSETLGEEESLLLILAQIPFFGYIISSRHKKIPHMRDISQLNLLVTIISCVFFVFGYVSLASLLVLIYIIMSVFQGIRLSIESKITTLDMSLFPTAEEKYTIQKALLVYVKNSLSKKKFSPLQDIKKEKTQAAYKKEISELEELKQLTPAKIPGWLFYIPFINFIGIFFINTQEKRHIQNGITLSVILLTFLSICWFLKWETSILIFFLFPIFYGIGYLPRKAYHMPYIYNIYAFFAYILGFFGHIFSRTRKLQKTDKQENIQIQNTKKES